jgi:hypothetical protein
MREWVEWAGQCQVQDLNDFYVRNAGKAFLFVRLVHDDPLHVAQVFECVPPLLFVPRFHSRPLPCAHAVTGRRLCIEAQRDPRYRDLHFEVARNFRGRIPRAPAPQPVFSEQGRDVRDVRGPWPAHPAGAQGDAVIDYHAAVALELFGLPSSIVDGKTVSLIASADRRYAVQRVRRSEAEVNTPYYSRPWLIEYFSPADRDAALAALHGCDCRLQDLGKRFTLKTGVIEQPWPALEPALDLPPEPQTAAAASAVQAGRAGSRSRSRSRSRTRSRSLSRRSPVSRSPARPKPAPSARRRSPSRDSPRAEGKRRDRSRSPRRAPAKQRSRSRSRERSRSPPKLERVRAGGAVAQRAAEVKLESVVGSDGGRGSTGLARQGRAKSGGPRDERAAAGAARARAPRRVVLRRPPAPPESK